MRSPRALTQAALGLATVLLLGACSAAPTQPGSDDAPLFAKGGGGGSCFFLTVIVITSVSDRWPGSVTR